MMVSAREQSLVLLKPDAVRRRLVGELLARLERKGLDLIAVQLRTIDGELADRHYAEHVDKEWYGPLRQFITSGPLVAVVVEGERAISGVRGLLGSTDGVAAAPGSIRGDFGLSQRENLVHGSDSSQAAVREIALYFPELATFLS
jgi:nucleoside-diphosphate kinase